MQLVKVGEQFYQECKKHGTDKELLFNKSGRPLLLPISYLGKNTLTILYISISSS